MNNKVMRTTAFKFRRILLLTSLAILAVLMAASLTGMTWHPSSLPLAADQPTLTPTLAATPVPSSWWGRFLQPSGDPANLTLGIIVMGGVIVIVILGGTFAVTRRKY